MEKIETGRLFSINPACKPNLMKKTSWMSRGCGDRIATQGEAES